jgi:hypothetical protein
VPLELRRGNGGIISGSLSDSLRFAAGGGWLADQMGPGRFNNDKTELGRSRPTYVDDQKRHRSCAFSSYLPSLFCSSSFSTWTWTPRRSCLLFEVKVGESVRVTDPGVDTDLPCLVDRFGFDVDFDFVIAV